LARIENKRKITNGKDGNKPTLRRTSSSTGNNDPNNPSSSTDDRPTLGRRD
jgi:beta-barrel assembly-enhancing protease